MTILDKIALLKLVLNTNLSNRTNLFLTDDRPWSALILIKGFILLEELLRARSQDSSNQKETLHQ